MNKTIKRILSLTALLLFTVVLFCGCGSKNKDNYSPRAESGIESDIFVNSATDRKIIYSAHTRLTVESIKNSVKQIKNALPEGSWIENESVSQNYATLNVRVKTTEFDSFISQLSTVGEVDDLEKNAEDVTDKYNTYVYEKQALEAEHARLLELLETESAEVIATSITPRLTEIEKQLAVINKSLNQYDSLIDYSKISIYLYQPITEEPETFDAKLSDAFGAGWTFVKFIVTFIIQFVIFSIPLLVLAVPIAGIVLLIVFLSKRKRRIIAEKNKQKATEISNETVKNNDKTE